MNELIEHVQKRQQDLARRQFWSAVYARQRRQRERMICAIAVGFVFFCSVLALAAMGAFK